MRNEPQMESAIIYQFPVGGRAGYNRFRKDASVHPEPHAAPLPQVDFDSWYHQEAILETSTDPKPQN